MAYSTILKGDRWILGGLKANQAPVLRRDGFAQSAKMYGERVIERRGAIRFA